MHGESRACTAAETRRAGRARGREERADPEVKKPSTGASLGGADVIEMDRLDVERVGEEGRGLLVRLDVVRSTSFGGEGADVQMGGEGPASAAGDDEEERAERPLEEPADAADDGAEEG